MEQQKGLKHGVYKINWKDGGSSLASIGYNYDGTNWYAPCNWTSENNENPMVASTKWDVIKSIEMLIESDYNKEYRKPCYICKDPTANIFNINLNHVSVCEECAKQIFIQQAKYYSEP